MEQTTEPLVVGVRFSKVGKIYHFAAEAITDIKVGDMVVVETSRGWQLGQIAQVVPNADPPPEGWKSIDRRATPRDLLLRQMWQMKESEVVTNCKARASDLRLVGIKIVSAEYSFDGARLTIFFSSESEEKYDLKSLRSDMQKMFAPSQVEMRQIGPRDVAKTHCGMGACGLETRCCCLFLTEFSSISIRMAKEQGISLTPTEITGMCGRLRCCLIYEYDHYVEARSKLPKRNKRVRTPQGEGKVVDVVPLRGAVLVDIPEVGVREFPGDDVQLVDGDGSQLPPPPSRTTEQEHELDQDATVNDEKKPFVPLPEKTGGGPVAGGIERTERPRSQQKQDRSRSERGRGDRPKGDQAQAIRGRQPDRQRQESPGRPDRAGGDSPRRETSQSETVEPGGSQAGPVEKGQGSGRRGPQGKPPRRENRPQSQAGQAGGKPGGSQQGQRSEGGGSSTARSNRDQRRRKGKRQDSNDNEERA